MSSSICPEMHQSGHFGFLWRSFHICHHQYFSHPSLTTVTFHSIVCHCMEDISAKKRDLDQNLVRIVVFSVPVLYIFLLVMWHFAEPMPPMCCPFRGLCFRRCENHNQEWRPCWGWKKYGRINFSLGKWNVMGQNTLKINEGICQSHLDLSEVVFVVHPHSD